MKLEILGLDLIDSTHAVLLTATLQRLARHENVESASLYVQPRTFAGWLEYGLSIRYTTQPGGARDMLYLGCIQCTPDSEPEFCS